MERRRLHLPALMLAALAAAIMSFCVPRLSHAAGEPTVAISLDDSALTTGETATVTFAFSSVPFNFADDDVDLSDANGTLSTVIATADPRRYTAVFTPNGGVNDPTNTIKVGTAWNDAGGLSPVSDSSSGNFSVQTVSGGGGGGSCPAPSVTLGSPNGGETLVAGSDVDVFWTMNGCQATTLSLWLSSDGGATYGLAATSQQPASGYYRWTVPDRPSPSSRLQVKLLGSGGTELASDESDGTFVIQPSSPPPGGGTAPPPEPSPPPAASPPAPTPAPAPGDVAPVPPASGTPPTSAAAPPAPAPAPKPAPKPAPPPPRNRPVAPTAPPIPLAQTTPAPDTSMPPTETPMDDANQNPATDGALSTLSLDSVQGAVETASGFVPSSLDLALSFVLGALTMLGLVLGTQQAIKRSKAKSTKRCVRCLGTGEEPPEKKAAETCGECDGAGQVEDENEPAVECKHCGGEGEDPCHRCKGSGKDAAGQDCPACKGGGKTLTGKQDKDGEDEVADCEICRGEGEVSATVKKMIPCEKCGGTGKI